MSATARFLSFTSLLLIGPIASADDTPVRLSRALDIADSVSISLIHRSRFENLVDNVQPGTSRNDQVLAQRTLFDVQYTGSLFSAELELADMRQSLADSDSVISTATVNSTDVLQANLGLRLGANHDTWLRFGRFTEDWGSRRLMARNRFRNTINAWDGLVLHQSLANNVELKAMATQVVNRLPGDRQSLLDNKHQSDRSYDARRFYGLHAELPDLFSDWRGEAYVYLLREKDTADLQTANRRLNSIGFRLRSASGPGAWDLELESVLQTGKRRASSNPLDTRDIDHQAFFQYAGLGYSFDNPLNLRVMFEFDYASGDADPFDGDNERFDSLFGPTTFEFGVVGLYNPFNRSNLVTPGLRLSADLSSRVDVLAVYRHFWLAEAKDSWGRTGIRDVSGQSGDYLGQHLQLRLRWDVIPGNMQVESGAIFLNAENLSDKNTEYFYAGTTFTF